jgi:hypothetical protein
VRQVERVLVLLGDRLNPILVKETRQALKSRQFLITFVLLLFLAWGWSILGIARIGPGAAVGAYGKQMLMGYLVILALPLIVVVPFGAYRSLAAEQETRTDELVSITAMGPRQIVAGKLGSAVVQMSVYLSAVSPCLAFTYLLRGIDFLTIFFVLFWIAMASLGAAAVGLLLATIAPRNQFQAIPMVAVVIGLFGGFWGVVGGAFTFLDENGPSLYQEKEFWIINAVVLTFFVAYFVMVCEAAAARISFVADNRSTRLRIIMVLQYLLLIGWFAVFWKIKAYYRESILLFMVLAGIHWYAMGVLMTGEIPRLSSRVKRRLPRTFLGRMFFSWFFPGPGTGYALAICGLLSTLLTAAIAYLVLEEAMPGRSSWMTPEKLCIYGVLALSYAATYLGLGLFFLRIARRITTVGLLLSVFLQISFILFGCLVPLVIQMTSPHLYGSDYSLLHVTNPFWTLSEVCNSNPGIPQIPALLIFVPLAAAGTFALNVPTVVREIRNLRILKPHRVIREDAAVRIRKNG